MSTIPVITGTAVQDPFQRGSRYTGFQFTVLLSNMNGIRSAQSSFPDTITRPAIGIFDIRNSTESVTTTVQRIQHRGYGTFVAYPADVESGVPSAVRRLSATVVEYEEDDEAVRQKLASAAKSQGYPGVIYHKPSKEIDLEASEKLLQSKSAYGVDSIPKMSDQKQSRLIGIPAYNEVAGIGSAVLGAQRYADEVVVIDDGSNDSTAEVAELGGAAVLQHHSNRGKGAAVKTFFQYARTSEHDEFVILDGDGQHQPEQIPLVAKPITEGEADLVIGSRYLDGTDDETPRYRRFGQWVLDQLTLGSSGVKLTDTQSGFRAFSTEAIDELEIRTDSVAVESEMTRIATKTDLEVTEQPINVRYEGVDGQTFNPVYHGFRVLLFLVGHFRDRHPLYFFGIPGLVCTAVGSVSVFNTLFRHHPNGAFSPRRVFLGAILTVIGLGSVFYGLMLRQMTDAIGNLEGETG